MKKTQIDDNLVKSIVEFEIEREKIQSLTTDKDILVQLKRDTDIEQLLHISNLLGMNFTISEIRSIYLGRRMAFDKADSNELRLIVNIRKCDEYIESVIDLPSTTFDLNMLSHINKIVLSGLLESWEIEMRGERFDDKFENVFEDNTKDKEYENWYEGMNELVTWTSENWDLKHSLIISFTILYGLLDMKPWAHANVASTLLIYDLITKKLGMDANGMIPSAWFISEYIDEIVRMFKFIQSEPSEYQRWVSKMSDLYAKFVRKRRLELAEKIAQIEKAEKEENEFLDLNRRQLKVLRYLQNVPKLKREDYVYMMEVSTMTAYRDLSELVKKKLLKVHGRGRGTKYVLVTK